MVKIREIASGLQFPEGPIAMDDGSVLVVEINRWTPRAGETGWITASDRRNWWRTQRGGDGS